MSSLSLPPFTPRLANGPYPERCDVQETAHDRWLASAYARWFLPAGYFAARASRFADQVEAFGPGLAKQSDAALRLETHRLSRLLRRQGLGQGPVAESFALVREMSARVLGKRHYRVQIMAGLAMIQGRVAEMATGEGKTLAATLPTAVAAMAGIPTHVLTVNEYLATRDAEEMGPLYHALGFSVGVAQEKQCPAERRQAYAADITYCTNKDIGFDYLRDRIHLKEWPSTARLAVAGLSGGDDDRAGLLMRGLHYAIVDEADSILIDEARTPLIISGQQDTEEDVELFRQALETAKTLDLGKDFEISAEDRSARLTEKGRAKAILRLGAARLDAAPDSNRLDLIVQALSALHLYQRDKHYLVSEGAVQIVDEFTGRVMPDRSWEMGLHQLIETKEGCELTGQRKTLAKITYQRLFRRYLRLAGMTGTAKEVAAELWAVYRLRVARIPTHRPPQRKTLPPRLLRDREEKWRTVIDAVREQCLERGRPVLIGTRSVEASEELSEALGRAGSPHQVLNARQDADEAQLVAQAGQ
ncbi:partial Protein translocase subunit SecA, partial [Gammaproteobacteria bacterium]